MGIALSAWLGISTAIAIMARKVGPWHRTIPGGLTWPLWPSMVAASWVKFQRKKRRKRNP